MSATKSPAGRLVLLVDDEQSMLKVLEARLESWGYRVILATNGPEGLEQAVAQHPDLILLDVMMPGMDGLEVCRRLRAQKETKRIPVILVTVKATQLSPEEVRGSGAFRVIGKPYDSEELHDAVEAALARRA
jgi:CheY-like chemotaxis protein